jgi:peptidoglycan hydrolase CwlO-like protein
MSEQSNGSFSPQIVLLLTAVAVAAIIGVLASIPAKQERVTVPDATSIAISDLRASQQQVLDQLRALQETTSADQANVKRLSDEVAALNGKLEALQPPFASAHQQISPPSAPVPTAIGQKRSAR